jgi:hypothetical protein
MKTLLTAAALFCCLLTYPLSVFGQELTIQVGTGKPIVLTRGDLESLPRSKVTAGNSGQSTLFEGVALRSVLEKAGVTFGDSLRGKRLASYLLVEAADDYKVVFALPELDPAFNDKQVVLAFLKDGKPLDAKEGPYRIVIPDEKRMSRWIRQVTMLKIVDVQ